MRAPLARKTRLLGSMSISNTHFLYGIFKASDYPSYVQASSKRVTETNEDFYVLSEESFKKIICASASGGDSPYYFPQAHCTIETSISLLCL